MAPDYRAVVRHVRTWRGNIHKWSTTYPFVNQPSTPLTGTDLDHLAFRDSAMCYGTSAADGGVWGVDLYKVGQKGSPILTTRYFDPELIADWSGYGSSGWTTTGQAMLQVAEPALVVEWAVGLSSSGKPVRLKKWYHAVPVPQNAENSPDVPVADRNSLLTAATAITGVFSSKGLSLGSSASRLAGSPTVLAYYGNHQMPKGRKRKPLVNANGQYTGPAITRVPTLQAD